MVSSAFCGHNKQQCRKMLFCLPSVLGERMPPRTSAPSRQRTAEQGPHCHLPEVSTGACTAPVQPAALQLPSSPGPGWVHREPTAGSVPAPLASTPCMACLHGVLLAAPTLQNEACRNWDKGLGHKAQSPAQPTGSLHKRNPPF